MTEQQQRVAPGYESVAEAFLATLPKNGQSGAQLSVWKDGEPIIDLCGGVADSRSGRRFLPDTLSVVFSCTKGLASLLIGLLVERGEMPPLDSPVVDIWPEFGAHGKDRMSIADLLGHRAGLSATREDLAPEIAWDSLALADILAAQEPLWKPGESHQYHTVTHGALTAKLVLLATGQSIGTVFADLIASPLGADAWIGLPESEEQRVSYLIADPINEEEKTLFDDKAPESLFWVERAANINGPIGPDVYNQPEVHRAELPGAGGIATAHALAKIWSSTVASTDGLRLINDDTVRSLSFPRSMGAPYFPGEPPYQSWGAGVMVPSEWQEYLSAESFGHDGAGGQVAFADPRSKIGFAYVTNRMGDPERGASVISALARILD